MGSSQSIIKMSKKINLTIEYLDHTTAKLTNSSGDTFVYDPTVHEGLDAFLSQGVEE